MTKTTYQYAIAQFMPFVETGEFANVGILLVAPKTGFVDFKLDTKRTQRITQFFEGLDVELYRSVIQNLKKQLEISFEYASYPGSNLTDTFKEIVRPRESILRFSESRMGITVDPKAELDQLFNHYVGRNFVTKEYIEAKIERTVRSWLTEARLARNFNARTVGDEIYDYTFPFVSDIEDQGKLSNRLKIIKPLNFRRSRSSTIIDLGGKWVYRINHLREHGHLGEGSRILYTVEPPNEKIDSPLWKAFKHARRELRNSEIEVTESSNRNKIIRFAEASASVN